MILSLHGARARVDQPAHDADERRLAGTVGPEQREDLAAPDLQRDVLQRLEARGVGLGKVRNLDHCLHGAISAETRRAHPRSTIQYRSEDPIQSCPLRDRSSSILPAP